MSTGVNALGFELARQARDPQFRGLLAALGYQGEPMVPADADATVQSVVDRVGDHEGRCLLAVRDEAESMGWRFAWWERVHP